MTTSPPPAAGALPPYWCFISYRHTDNKQPGRQWATWLHQQIETYEVPEDLVGTANQRGEIIPERIFPVFRDEEELPADADLGSPIYRALDRSLFLLVLCSPQAVQSTYVANEIAYFKKLGRSNSVLAAMIEGEPNASWDEGKQKAGLQPSRECFPDPLQFLVDARGNLDRSQRAEPIAADFRLPNGGQGWTSPEAFRQSIDKAVPKAKVDAVVNAYRQQCELARLKIIAGILGVPLGTLTQRDKAYQLEKERQRAKTFRKVATALGLLAVAAVGASILAYFKREEAVVNQRRAESATITATQNQHRAESAEGEAKNNLERATGLLWEASYTAWNEAERSYRAGDPQAALAYLAAGMRNAPANTGLFTFASSILGEPNHPLRTLTFDNPVANVAYTREVDEVIVAELIYSEATRYSLWNIATVEKTDEVLVPTDTEITAEQKTAHPWLEFAPPTRKSNNAEGDKLEEVWSPCSMRSLTADHDRISITGEGISWTHPWFNFSATPASYALPDSNWTTGYAWSPDGNRVVTAHGYIDSVTEQNRGRVQLWELRQTPGFSLLPIKTTPLADLAPEDTGDYRIDGDYMLGSRENGHDVYKIGEPKPLWSTTHDPARDSTSLSIHSRQKEAILLRAPLSPNPAGEPAPPTTVTIERRSLDDGRVLATATMVLSAADLDHGLPTATPHPAGQGYALAAANLLLSWNGSDPQPLRAPDLGPRDAIGWSGTPTFLPDGQSLLFATQRKLLLLSWPELTLIAGPRYHETMISDVAISEDGTRAVSAAGFGDGEGSSGFIQVWSLPDLTPVGPRLHHANQVDSVTLVNSGQAFISSTESPEGSDIRLWDTKTGSPLTNYLVTPPGTGQSFLTFDDFIGGTISAITTKGQVDALGEGLYSTRIPTPDTPIPAWFHQHFLPLVAGKILSPLGSLEPIPVDRLNAHYKQVQAKLDAAPPEQDDIYLRFVRWHLANPSGRTIAPYAEQTLDAFLEEHYFAPLRDGTPNFDASGAYCLDPSHPLLHLHLALNEKDQEKQLHYLKYGYYRLTRPSNGQTYGKERWHEQMRTAQKLLTILKQPAAVEELEKIINEG